MPVLNCETSIPGLLGGVVMSNEHFYVRNHFLAPALDPSGWRLKVSGLVKQPMILSLREILNMPARTLQVTLECAGNGRSLLIPTVGGEQWGLGAVSTAEWTGVPLAALLKGASVDSDTREVVFSGADHPAGESAGKTGLAKPP
jgi:DMSO/TMAO reductase YedYZ molybdopterin-dependent catalytic subunit